MKKLISLPMLVSLITVSFSSQSFARDKGGLFVEPGLTYQISTSNVTYPAPISTTAEADSNGFGLMARLGFHISESFFIAADGRYLWSDFKDDNNNFDTDAETYNLAPVLGIQMSEIGLRIWGSVILAGDMNPSESNGTDFRFRDARGYRIGAGFRVFSLSLNLEYEDLNYQRSELSNGTTTFTGPSSELKLDTESYILSVSFPLEL